MQYSNSIQPVKHDQFMPVDALQSLHPTDYRKDDGEFGAHILPQ